MIIIPGGTDCYYCINNMTCLLHVYYCLLVLVTVPDHLSAIMLHVYLLLCLVHVTLSVVAYYSCTCILCIVYMPFSIYLADIMTRYTQLTSLLDIHNTISWLYCICSSACSRLSRHHDTTYLLYQTETSVDMTR